MHRIHRNTLAVAPFLRKWKTREKKDRCLVCGERMKLTLQRHHIDGNDKNSNPNNICLLCGSCHTITFSKASPQEAIEAFKKRNQNSKRGIKAWRKVRNKKKMWSTTRSKRFPHGIKARAEK